MITITDKKQCSGCSACATTCPIQCITMKEDEEGFLYPQVNQKLCIKCQKCITVCPIINPLPKRTPQQCHAAYHIKTRETSSSGGLFYWLAYYILQQKGVVCGVVFNKDWTTEHRFIDKISDLQMLQGSKYVQSNTKDTYRQTKEFLKSDIPVLYTGTPCQIAGLHKYLGKKINKSLLFTVELCCHGVPSPRIWKQYLKENVTDNITHITFRSKVNGWKNYTLNIQTNGHTHICEGKLSNNYMRGFLMNLYCRPICSSCKFREFRTESDLSIGDFWGLPKFYPLKDDDKGMSLILIMSEKGNILFKAIKNELCHFPISYEEVINGNTNYLYSSPFHPKREQFWKMINGGESVNHSVSQCLKLTFIQNIKSIIKRFLRWEK